MAPTESREIESSRRSRSHRSLSGARRKRRRRRRRSISDSYDRSRSGSYHSRHRSRSHSRRRRRRRRKHRKRRYSRSYSSSRSRSSERESRSKRRSRRTLSEDSHKSVNSDEGLSPEQIEEKRELERLTRDARTVFVSQLQVKVTEKDIKKFFERVCKVKEVVLIKDKFTNKSKGYGYVELRTLEDVPLALQLTGQKFIFPNGKEGFPVLIKASEAEKNFTHSLEKKNNTATATYSVANGNAQRNRAKYRNNPILKEPWPDKIEIKSIHRDVPEEQIKELCGAFGEVIELDLIRDLQGRSTGQCFVQYKDRDQARAAVKELDGIELVDQKLKVYKMQKGQISKLKGTSQKDVDRMVGIDDDSGMAGGAFSTATWRLEADDTNVGRYGGSGVAMNASQKMNLMSKLAGGAGNELLMESRAKSVNAPESEPKKTENVDDGPGRITGAASRCLLIKNLFDPQEETENEWDKIIAEDVSEEAGRYGKVEHIFVDAKSMGNVFLCMQSVQNGVDCATDMHGRWFAKRLVTVEYIKESLYAERFPEIKKG